jgi:hypothetical protein
MQTLLVLYSALAVFGLGVTIVDLFGVFDQLGSAGDSADGGAGGDTGGESDSGDDGAADDGGGDGHDADANGADADADTSGAPDADQGADTDGGQAVQASHAAEHGHAHGDKGSYVAAADAGTRLVAKTIGTLRGGVYFSLGAGPTGLFAVLTGVAPAASLAWSAGAGLFIAILAKALRAFIRKDLDSSIKPEEFLMDSARISVPVSPGAMGKAIVRRYGRDNELYVRCKDAGKSLSKGAEVHIVDWDDDCYWVE